MPTVVDSVYQDSVSVLETLKEDLSLSTFANDHLRKLVLLSAASHFEHELSEAMVAFARISSGGHEGIVSLVRAKAVERQYHTWFDWKNKSANSFYRMLGDQLGGRMKEEIKQDENLKTAERAFLELGSLRNQLVHQNFAVFPLDKTTEEVFQLYQSACRYVAAVVGYLENPHLQPSESEED